MTGNAAELLRRSTVHLHNRHSAGSGLVVRDGATVLTNAHVVGSASKIRVQLWDGRMVEGTVTHRHASRDLALVRIPASTKDTATAAAFASSATLRPGAFVMAVGNPLGFTGALSTGVIYSVGEWIRASVRLAPGNSGGPLADANGFVVGINTMAASNGALALAIPSDAALAFLKRPKGVALGITVHPAPAGLVITSLDPSGAAAKASLLVGDVLLNYRSPEDLRRNIEQADGGAIQVEFQRGGRPNRRSVLVTPPA